MKESHWKVLSFVFLTALIVTSASWAKAQSTTGSGYTPTPGSVLVEGNKQR
jgi:hypothetical protein